VYHGGEATRADFQVDLLSEIIALQSQVRKFSENNELDGLLEGTPPIFDSSFFLFSCLGHGKSTCKNEKCLQHISLLENLAETQRRFIENSLASMVLRTGFSGSDIVGLKSPVWKSVRSKLEALEHTFPTPEWFDPRYVVSFDCLLIFLVLVETWSRFL
jgi:hypothetical protein